MKNPLENTYEPALLIHYSNQGLFNIMHLYLKFKSGISITIPHARIREGTRKEERDGYCSQRRVW